MKNLGQTSVEYIFLVAIIVTIILNLMPALRDGLIANGDCVSTANTSYICQMLRTSGFGPGLSGNYRTFTLRR